MNKITRLEYYTNEKRSLGSRHTVIVDTIDSDVEKTHALVGTMCSGFLNKLIKQARAHKAKIVKLKNEKFQIHWLH